MNQRFTVSAILLPAVLLINASAAADPSADKRVLERGRYVVSISGCNDCHTPGYPETDGKTPVAEWLTGSPVGFQGPWGTSYPANLRLYVQGMSEAQWIARVRQPMRPPMPWFNLRDMSDADLTAVYRFVRSLGARGEPAPAPVAPGTAVNTPFIEFVPKNLPKQAHATR
jgi:mono/diheme cytochrome c family protein